MNQSSPSPAPESARDAKQDLLAHILRAGPNYPWQPADPEAEPYLASLEAEFDALADTELEAAIATGWQTLSAQLISQMSPPEPLPPSVAAVLNRLDQFQGRLPGDLLQSLATAATTLTRSSQPLINQLVQCVNTVLPTWETEDLMVLARPLAYSLRDGRGEILNLNLRAIPTVDWEALSDLEQARLTLTIASLALKAAQSPNHDPSQEGGWSDQP
jgi:hypothetical protein